MPTIHFTHKDLEAISPPAIGRVDYFGDDPKGLVLRVSSSGSKIFYAMCRVGGKGRLARVKIGAFPVKPLDEAKKEAKKVLCRLADGEDITRQEKADEAKDITLQEVFEKLVEVRKEKLKSRTVGVYRQMLDLYLADWMSKPLRKITTKEVETRFRQTSAKGLAAANSTFRTFRLIWNFGNAYYGGILGDNPAGHLSALKIWNTVRPRKRHIPSDKLMAWHNAVMELDNVVVRDFLLTLIYTGLRRNEAACLKWQDVDMAAKSFLIRDPKNGEDLTLPITTQLEEIFTRRLDLRENDFLFPGRGKTGHIDDPKKAVAIVSAKINSPFSSHDLRRTFTTAGAAELLIHPFIMDALTNHIGSKKDMTRDYTVITVERLRESAQAIADHLAKMMRKGQEDFGG